LNDKNALSIPEPIVQLQRQLDQFRSAQPHRAKIPEGLEMLGQVYGHDAEARDRGLTPDERLRLHQERSAPVMDELHIWLESQLAERRTEPNSGLGQAINYLLRHWLPLTLFLRQTGAPLDNNLVERALKRAVLHRKNALYYRTLNGAPVGDLFMSLIHICQLCGANSFDYLIELQRHARELADRPDEWMPWNYRDTLMRTAEVWVSSVRQGSSDCGRLGLEGPMYCARPRHGIHASLMPKMIQIGANQGRETSIAEARPCAPRLCGPSPATSDRSSA